MRCGDTRHQPGFSCPAAKYQCKACSKVGHFTSQCLTKPKTVNQITGIGIPQCLARWFQLLHLPDTRPKDHHQTVVCQPTTCTTAPPSTLHILKGMHRPRCRCQCHACSSLQTANRWYRTKEPWPCKVYHAGLYNRSYQKPWELESICKVSWTQTRTYHIQHHRPRRQCSALMWRCS